MHEQSTLLIASSTACCVGIATFMLLKWRRESNQVVDNCTPTSFEAYLTQNIDNPSVVIKTKASYASTSFDAYLTDPSIGAEGITAPTDTSALDHHDVEVDLSLPSSSKPITVLYGTEFGFSREIAEKLCDAILTASEEAISKDPTTPPLHPELIDMADLPKGFSLHHCQALFVICSTQGDGVPPTEAKDFVTWLNSTDAPSLSANTAFSVCALGDSSYAHFCRCGRTIDKRLENLGGERVVFRVDVNREDWKAVDGWIDRVVSTIGDGTLTLKTCEELDGYRGVMAERNITDICTRDTYSKSRPYFGKVVAVEGLCNVRSDDDKNTVRVEIELGNDPSLQYLAGDALGVWPCNQPSVVQETLQLLNPSVSDAASDETIMVPVPSWHYRDEACMLDTKAVSIPLVDALSKCYDLRSPKPELLKVLLAKLEALYNGGKEQKDMGYTNGKEQHHRHRAHDSVDSVGASINKAARSNGNNLLSLQKGITKLQKLLSSNDTETVDPLTLYLSERHVADILRDYYPATLTYQELLPCLRQLAPRLYSISSSPLEAPNRVQITVAVVRYTSLNAPRSGVASTYLGERLKPGMKIPVYIYKNPDFRMPEDGSTPMLMIGPGTGLAPFRAFIMERFLLKQAVDSINQVLLFGSRRRDQDYLYGRQLEQWAKDGNVTLFTAFSREPGKKKVYVQQRLREQGELVWDLLQRGGHVYICGDGDNMAPAVEKALLEVIQKGLTEEGATSNVATSEEYLDRLIREKRYQKDVWST